SRAPAPVEDGWRSDCLPEFLAGTEGHLLAGLDLDRFPGNRMAAHAGSTIPHLQNPETDKLHALAFLQVRGDHFDEIFEYRQGGRLAELKVLRQFECQVFGRNRWGRRLGCRCHVSHRRGPFMRPTPAPIITPASTHKHSQYWTILDPIAGDFKECLILLARPRGFEPLLPPCPLYPRKRTCAAHKSMSALCQ